MNKKLQNTFEACVKNGTTITSVDVVRIVKSYGLPFTRRTLQKWAALGVIEPPEELNSSIGNGRRTGYTYQMLVQILALRITVGAVTGLGKGSRIRRRFTAARIALEFVKSKAYNIDGVAKGIDFRAIGLANSVTGYRDSRSPIKLAKLIRLVALIYCFCYKLVLEGSMVDIVGSLRILENEKVFASTRDAIGINEGLLSRIPINKSVLTSVELVLNNLKEIYDNDVRTDLLAWTKAIQFFDSNGWVADLAKVSLKKYGYVSFGENSKANWLAAVLYDG